MEGYMTPSPKEKKIKAWCIVDKVGGVIESADYFACNECPASENTNAEAIYLSRSDAKGMLIPDVHKIIPCQITYQLPSKKK